MKKIVFSITAILFLASCSDDGIPSSGNTKTVDWSSLKKPTSVSGSEVEGTEEDVPEITTKKDLDANSENSSEDVSENISSNDSESNEEYSEEEYSDKDEVSQSENIDEVVEQSETEIALEETERENSTEDLDQYKKDLEAEMTKALVNYPRPPSPANLSPYDSREKSSYREATVAETKGSGDFPPSPPAMLLNTN